MLGQSLLGPPDVIETPRLLLRRPRLDDAATIFTSYASDPDVTRYLLFRPDQSLEEVEDFLKKALAAWVRGSSAAWAITLRTDGSLIGMIDLRLEGEANLGYVLARRYWNQGLMTEAVRGVVDWALNRETIHRVWAVCEVNNLPSARVLEKAGFQLEERLERWMVFPNLGELPRDCYRYGIGRGKTGQ